MRRRSQPPAVAPAPAPDISRRHKLLLAGAMLLLYGVLATWGQFDFSDLMGYYNLLADGFLAGHLYVGPTPDQGPLQDMIPYQGHYYVQWGPFPAVLHMAAKLFGGRLSDRVACLLAGWLGSLVFLEICLHLRRRFFPAISAWVPVWFFFAFALATPTAIVSLRGTDYHESIAVAALGVLAALWAWLRYTAAPGPLWAALCGAALAVAVTSRVTQGLYAAPLALGLYWAGRRWVHLVVFAFPVVLAGLLMLAYNHARFGSPLDYGYQYLPTHVAGRAPYALVRVPENFRHYLLAPPRLERDLPWIRHTGWPPLVHTERAEDMSSLLLASPFVLWGVFAFRTAAARRIAFVTAGAGLLAFFALLCFTGTSRRYAQDFLPMFVILAFLGAGAIALDWRRWRWPAYTVLVLSALLHLHLTFFQAFHWYPADVNVMKTFVAWSPPGGGPRLREQEGMTHNDLGVLYLNQRRYAEAVRHFEQAAARLPDAALVEKNLRVARTLAANQGP